MLCRTRRRLGIDAGVAGDLAVSLAVVVQRATSNRRWAWGNGRRGEISGHGAGGRVAIISGRSSGHHVRTTENLNPGKTSSVQAAAAENVAAFGIQNFFPAARR